MSLHQINVAVSWRITAADTLVVMIEVPTKVGIMNLNEPYNIMEYYIILYYIILYYIILYYIILHYVLCIMI